MPTSGFTGGYSYRTTNSGAFVKSFQDLLSFYPFSYFTQGEIGAFKKSPAGWFFTLGPPPGRMLYPLYTSFIMEGKHNLMLVPLSYDLK
jgi:hypothetical protein